MKDLDVLQNVEDNDMVMGYSRKGNKYGLIEVGKLNGSGYAGCRWSKSLSSPEGEPCGSLEKIRQLPDLLALGGYLVENNHSRRKLSASDHRYFEDGTPAALDGTMGHYQWGWGVPFYYASWEDENYTYEAIDVKPIPGHWNYYIPIASRSCAGYATIDRQENRLVSYVNSAARYRGGNNDASKDTAYNSMLGLPATNVSHLAADTYARANGDMWAANVDMMIFITGALKRIIFHNKNIQAGVQSLTADMLRRGGTGQGADLPADWGGKWEYYPYIPLAARVEYGDYTGVLSTTINDNGTQRSISFPSFFGLKNDYKYLGVLANYSVLQNNADYSQSMYVVDEWDGSPLVTDPAKMHLIGRLACNPSEGAAWKSMKKQNHERLVSFPIALGGSESTYDCDSYYWPKQNSGLRAPCRLGAADSGGTAGSCYLRGYYGLGVANAYCGLVLCEACEKWTTKPFMA